MYIVLLAFGAGVPLSEMSWPDSVAATFLPVHCLRTLLSQRMHSPSFLTTTSATLRIDPLLTGLVIQIQLIKTGQLLVLQSW